MNLTALKSPGLWISVVSAILGLLISNGVILSGSSLDTVLGYVLALAGTLTGHQVALPASTSQSNG